MSIENCFILENTGTDSDQQCSHEYWYIQYRNSLGARWDTILIIVSYLRISQGERSLRQKITGSLQRNATVFRGIDLAEGFLISDNDGHFTLHL